MKFWVDMDNAPHVLVLRPVIEELERRGHTVEITARDYGQTLPLLKLYGMEARCVGRHGGKSRMRKYLAFATRTLSLAAFAATRRFDAAFAHGSRSLIAAAGLVGLPVIGLADYEYTEFPRFMLRWIRTLLVPDVIPESVLAGGAMPRERVHGYPGLKEDLYIHDFDPDPSFLTDMRIDPERVLVLVRPPAMMAHYAVEQSDTVFKLTLERLGNLGNVQVLLLPRTPGQRQELEEVVRVQGYTNVTIPGAVYHGPNLIWHSDLVISGGGTMNREAATLGVPVFSIYQGPIGAVDRHLMQAGKLVHVKDADGVRSIPVMKRSIRTAARNGDNGARVRDFIVERILAAAAQGRE